MQVDRENRPAQLPASAGKSAQLPTLLSQAGISLAEDKTHFVLTEDTFSFRSAVERGMRRTGAKDFLLSELADLWSDPEALRSALQPTRSVAAVGMAGDAVMDSVIRMLLQCVSVQTELAQQLLEGLADHQEELESPASSHAGMPLAKLVLSQFRWLEHVVDGSALLETIGQMLQVAEPALRRELVQVLPDVVVDGQHADAVKLLAELLREDSQFTAPVLESLSSLHLDKEMEKEMCDLVTTSVSSSRVSDLPAILRFLLEHITTESASKVIGALRSALSHEFLGEGGADVADEALVLDALLSALRLRADLGMHFLSHMEAMKRAVDHKPIDWWLVTALTTACDAKCRTRTARLLSDCGAKSMFKPSLVRSAIIGHGVSLRPHYAVQLSLAAGLVRSSSSANARSLGGEVYKALFEEYSEPYDRQEMICGMLTHVGSGAASEVDASLLVLVELASRDPAGVAQFSSFLTGVLDYLDGLSVSQARLAFELFARIAYDAHAGSSRLADELQITIRKQLTSTAPRYKSLGVLGGCCLLGRLGARQIRSPAPIMGETCVPGSQGSEDGRETETEVQADPEMDATKQQEADALLALMLKYSSAPDGSFGFLLHELSLLVAARCSPLSPGAPATPALEHELIGLIVDRITSSFETEYLHDIEALPSRPNPIRGVPPALALALDEGAEIAINVLSLLDNGDAPASQRHALCTLSATFQLLRVCEAATSDDGQQLEDLFDSDAFDGFESRPTGYRETTCLALFYTVDWLRELVNAFCTQTSHDMRKKVLTRLKQLLWMERLLDSCLGLTPTFRLPAAICAEPEVKKKGAPRSKKGESATGSKATVKDAGKAAASKGKGKAVAKPKTKKARKSRGGSDIDDSDEEGERQMDVDEEEVEHADVDDADAGGGAGGAGASSTAAPKAAKKPPGTKPTSTLPALGHLSHVLPYLRGLSMDASSLLTFTASLDESPETEQRELTESLTPPSVHYLLLNLHETLKTGLGATSVFGSSAAGKPRQGANGQDLSSMELSRLAPSALLVRLTPTLKALSRHAKILSETMPTVLECPGQVMDVDAAYGGEENQDQQCKFVEPALMLVMASLRKLLGCKQISDDVGQAALHGILASFGPEDGAEPASQQSPETAATACGVAFDFWADLFPNLPSIALQSEVIAVCKGVLDLLERLPPTEGAQLAERRERLASLASSCLQRESPDDRDMKNFKDKAPASAMVKTLFEVEAAYCASPVELLSRWAMEILPGLAEEDLDTDDAFTLEACPLFTKSSSPHFIGILFDLLTNEAKALPFPTASKASRSKAARGAEEDEGGVDEEATEAAAELIERTHDLCKAFVQLVQSTKLVDFRKKDGTSSALGRGLNKKAIIASHRFVGLLNKHMLPLMTTHFTELSTQIMAMLKSVQPATRLLQVHCTMVKERQQIAALQPAAFLKRELESLVFQVKVLLKSHDCSEAFWMGNLKHKSLSGQEVSSQLAVDLRERNALSIVEAKEPKEPKSKAKGKKRKKTEDDEEEDGEYEHPPASTVHELEDDDDDEDAQGEDEEAGEGEEEDEEEDD